MKKHDIVLVNFPFSDLSQTKFRPAIIVATPGGQNIILCQITTKKRSTDEYEVQLLRTYVSGDIRFDSNIYVDMIFTLDKKLIKKTLGRVENKKTQSLIQEKVQNLFA